MFTRRNVIKGLGALLAAPKQLLRVTQKEKPHLDTVLDRLYASELNCELSSFWDARWRIRLGDEQNGFVAAADMLHLPEVAAWLCAVVPEHYPNSEFARWVAD